MRTGRPIVDRKGQRYGLLVVLELADVDRRNPAASKPLWRCLCDCGNYTIKRGGDLQQGATVSCGCEKLRRQKAAVTTHGHSSGGIISRAYTAWSHMRKRCLNTAHRQYKDYGGRGITICKRWDKFENFLADMGEPGPGLSIDRRNNDKGYYKRNCKWSTQIEQNNNRRNSVKVKVNGKEMSAVLAHRQFGIPFNQIYEKRHRSFTI